MAIESRVAVSGGREQISTRPKADRVVKTSARMGEELAKRYHFADKLGVGGDESEYIDIIATWEVMRARQFKAEKLKTKHERDGSIVFIYSAWAESRMSKAMEVYKNYKDLKREELNESSGKERTLDLESATRGIITRGLHNARRELLEEGRDPDKGGVNLSLSASSIDLWARQWRAKLGGNDEIVSKADPPKPWYRY